MRRIQSFGLALVITTYATSTHAADEWWAPDKAVHFSISVGLAGAGYGGASLLWQPRWVRALVGAGFSLTLGLGKEIYDARGPGRFSGRDLVWDVAGTATGVGLALLIDWLFFSPEEDVPKDVVSADQTL